MLEDQSFKQQSLELIERRNALQQVIKHLIQTGSQLLISSDSHQTQLSTVRKQLQQVQVEIDRMQDQPDIQAFSLQQYQEQLQAIESQTYAKFVQVGLLKRSPKSVLKSSVTLSDARFSSVEVNPRQSAQ